VIAAFALLAVGVAACSSTTSNSSARAACTALRDFEQRRDLNDEAGMRTQLRRAERLADESGNDDLAGYISEAAALMDDLAEIPRAEVLQPKYLALIARMNGNLSFAEAECADAGYPTALSSNRD
jgi:dihydrodipicolinate synthase/N-acetylneuraminate lyase